MAIEHALTVLSWFENLQEDERPPQHLWEDEQGLDMWWKQVDEKRKDGVSTSRGRTDDPANDDQRPQMTENDHARFLKEAMS